LYFVRTDPFLQNRIIDHSPSQYLVVGDDVERSVGLGCVIPLGARKHLKQVVEAVRAPTDCHEFFLESFTAMNGPHEFEGPKPFLIGHGIVVVHRPRRGKVIPRYLEGVQVLRETMGQRGQKVVRGHQDVERGREGLGQHAEVVTGAFKFIEPRGQRIRQGLDTIVGAL
jgi:hypothetical protein